MRQMRLYVTAIALVTAAACASKTTVAIPPRVELDRYGAIGMVRFESNRDAEIEADATEEFLHSVQLAQPGAAVLELGGLDEVLRAVGHERLGPAAIRAIGEHYAVDALLTGRLRLVDPKPSIRAWDSLRSVAVKAEVEGSLVTRLVDTLDGATLWTATARASEPVAHARIVKGGPVGFGGGDPREAHARLVRGLAASVTSDFYVTYDRR
jgi:hypothetical protein